MQQHTTRVNPSDETIKIGPLAWIIHEVSSQKSKDALKG